MLVLMVRESVSLMLSLTTVPRLSLRRSRRFSRMRSKTTTVSVRL